MNKRICINKLFSVFFKFTIRIAEKSTKYLENSELTVKSYYYSDIYVPSPS